MSELLPDAPLLAAFLTASFLLAVTPGPGVVYIVTRTLAQGRTSGLASVAGVAAGNLGSAIAASIGLAALLAVSSTAFLVVKYAGAAYLIYLGVQLLRNPTDAESSDAATLVAEPSRVFLDGFLVALLNPKTALFFGAFLPQFLSSATPQVSQLILLGGLFVAIAAVTDTLYALTAAKIAPYLHAAGGKAALRGRRLAGCTFVGLGILTAASGSPRCQAPCK